MDSALAAVVVATITTIGAVIVGLMQAFKKEAREAVRNNNEDHAIVQQQLRMIFKTVNRVEDRVDGHLTWHTKGVDDGRSKERDSKLTK